MKLILLGKPGSGKGTQARLIQKQYGIPQISTGDILRAIVREGGDLGKRVKELIDAGNFVPDDMIVDLVKRRISRPDCEKGFVLDGFPRTIPQVGAIRDACIFVEAVLCIEVPDEEIIRRMSGRFIHLASGRTYHANFNPPEEEGRDDETGEALIQREDDREEAIVRKRLDVYCDLTQPLVGYYQKWENSGDTMAPNNININGVGKISEVRDRIFNALDEMPASRSV